MVRSIVLPTLALALLTAPAFAADNTCKPPPSPSVPDGKKVESHDLVVAANDVKAFMLSSDNYQLCLNDWLDKEKAEAQAAMHPLDAKIQMTHDNLGDANQKEKERVGALYSAAAADYYKLHPRR